MYAFVTVGFVKGFHEAAVEMELAASMSQCGQGVPEQALHVNGSWEELVLGYLQNAGETAGRL